MSGESGVGLSALALLLSAKESGKASAREVAPEAAQLQANAVALARQVCDFSPNLLLLLLLRLLLLSSCVNKSSPP
jgi:hypothetical protein